MLARMTAGVLGATLFFGSIGFGQEQPPPPDGPPNFAQMRQEMMDRLKEAVGASDDEWKVIQPRIEKVQDLQRQTGGRGPGMFMGPPPGGPGGGPGGPPPGGPDNANGPQAARDNGGGPGPGPGGPPPGGPDGGFGGPGGPGGPGDFTPSEVQQKQMDLHETLQSQDASPDEVKAKVTALREARAKAKVQLAQAQEELRGVLSLRQEAVLVTFGILE